MKSDPKSEYVALTWSDYTIWEVNEMAAFDRPVAKALNLPQTLPLLVAFSSIAANLEGVKAFCFRQEKVVYLYPQFWQQISLCCEVKHFLVPSISLSGLPVVISLLCWCWAIPVGCSALWSWEVFNGCLRHFIILSNLVKLHQLEQFSQKQLEKESDPSILLHWPTLDTPKDSCFPASLSGKRWELAALRITLYLYCKTAINCFFRAERGRGSYRERNRSFLSAPEMLVWEILVIFFFFQLL